MTEEEEHVANDPATETAAKSTGEGLHKVRPTNQPGVEIEVDDRELADLRALGFLPAADEKKGR